jgi:ubiquinone/menaquinone biosynthesis C-methylase UbiE
MLPEGKMNRRTDWDMYWQQRANQALSNFEYDRGRSPRDQKIEQLSNDELLSFIQVRPDDIILDAGCGSGVNIERLHSRVRRIIAMDFNRGSVERARERTRLGKMDNVEVFEGNIIDISLPNCSVDKILCMSVLQYLSDSDVRQAFREFRRIVRPEGMVILHVKNISSIYLSTLYIMKKVKSMFRGGVIVEYYRSYRWYFRELQSAGFSVTDYNSFNILMFERMPKGLRQCLEKYELSNYNSWLLRIDFVRRHGADLKIKAQLV